MELDPGLEWVHAQLSWAYGCKGDYPQAITENEKAGTEVHRISAENQLKCRRLGLDIRPGRPARRCTKGNQPIQRTRGTRRCRSLQRRGGLRGPGRERPHFRSAGARLCTTFGQPGLSQRRSIFQRYEFRPALPRPSPPHWPVTTKTSTSCGSTRAVATQ